MVKEPPVKKKLRKLGEDRIDEAISGFQETLVDFCPTAHATGKSGWSPIWIIRPGTMEGLEAVV